MLPPDVEMYLEAHLGASVEGVTPVGGGCIAHACRVTTAKGRVFVKYGDGEVARSFPAEAEGLAVLRAAASPLVIPEVRGLRAGTEDAHGVLVLEWIEPGTQGPHFWTAFAEGLAALHTNTDAQYGFDTNNFIGRTPQRNARSSDWPGFFGAHRLSAQATRARRGGRWLRAWDRPFEALLARLPDLLPAQPPAALLHGDLWGGNFMVDADGRAVLVDPAVYYGHAETDLAMTQLFGGFDPHFYAAYRAAAPMTPGYAERRDVYNLYHRLNHLNLFGTG
ncbi:MAG: phosphotransferase, partial [Rhodobacteraceae bacterium]|nr:phosphotransferase [Paracoccaceae bacterium]